MKAFVTVGISCSGKSFWAKEYTKKHRAIISNRDDLRFSLTGCKDWGEYRFDKKIEALITSIQYHTIERAAKLEKDIIIADTNLNPNTRNALLECATSAGYETELKPFPITLEEAWKRDALRPNGVGQSVIYRQWQQWLDFIERKRYTPDTSLPKAVMFDIDGTLAHMNGRGPFEWNKVDTDIVDKHVRRVLWSYQDYCECPTGNRVIIVSGRDGSCKELTAKWIEDNNITYDELFMREANDNRKDTIIKEEIFWRDIAPHYNVEAVFDDRPCVVRMWNDIGIPKVIAVGNQQIEF